MTYEQSTLHKVRAAQFAHVYGVYAVSLGGGCRRLKSETTMQQGKLARVGDGGGEGGGRDDLFSLAIRFESAKQGATFRLCSDYR